MTIQDISSLDPTWKRVSPVALSMAWRIAGSIFVCGLLLVLVSKTTPPAAMILVQFGAFILIVHLVLARSINRDFGAIRLEIAHVKYGYLVTEHLIKGLGNSASLAFVWRVLLINVIAGLALGMLGAALLMANGELAAAAAFLSAHRIEIDRGTQQVFAHVGFRIMLMLAFLPVNFLVNWLACGIAVRWLTGKRKPRFTYVLMPADANESAEPHLSAE